MGPRLRVTAGPSQDQLNPITLNSGQAHRITSDLFDGEVVAYIKDFVDDQGKTLSPEYFEREDRHGVTWSIQVRGRFLVPRSADDILFGNTFDRPFHLPWGTAAVLKFMNYIDPTLEHDLQSQSKPWALSPLISTMPHFAHHRIRDSAQAEGAFPPSQSLKDDTSELHFASLGIEDEDEEMQSAHPTPTVSEAPSPAPSTTVEPATSEATDDAMLNATGHHKQQQMSFETAAERRSFFSSPENRQKVMFGPLDVIETDFCYGFLQFSPKLSLQIPGGFSFDLGKYWDGQPVRFVCCERRKANYPDPWGKLFWCVSIEMVDDDDDDDEMDEGEEDELPETSSANLDID